VRHEQEKPFSPGAILKEMYLDDLDITQAQLAEMIGCNYGKINEIVNGKRGITPDFAIDLERTLKVEAEMWVNLQGKYDLWRARKKREEVA
jgi:antitoxin HigA-1